MKRENKWYKITNEEHDWLSPPEFSYSYNYVAVENHQCTICGARIGLMQTVHVYVRKCRNCGAQEKRWRSK